MPPAKLPFGLFAAMAAPGASLFYKAFFLQDFLNTFSFKSGGPLPPGPNGAWCPAAVSPAAVDSIVQSPLPGSFTLRATEPWNAAPREPVLRERTPGLLAYSMQGGLRRRGELER